MIFTFSVTWPFIKRVKDPKTLLQPIPKVSVLRDRQWVVLPDGRTGWVHHHKIDGCLGVRPVDPVTGDDLPNTSEHWPPKARRRYPEEIRVDPTTLRPAAKDDLPFVLR